MSGQVVGSLILWLIVLAIIVAIVVWLLNWLYHRSSKEVSFVRTGLGGEKVVINGGALVLPIVHEITPVNMNVVRLAVNRDKENAIITADRMRVDIEAEFFLRVADTTQAVAAAATTLGRRTMETGQLAELLSGKFIGALRTAAAEMTLEEMHARRGDFVTAVAELATKSLEKNGLELESVAIVNLDQTELEYFNPANRFDAEGLTNLIGSIEERRKSRNDIEQSAMLAIRGRNLDAEKETLLLDKESALAHLNHEREIEASRAAQKADIARDRAAREAEATNARIDSEQVTNEREIVRRKTIEAAEINAREEIEQRRIRHEQELEETRIDREQILKAKQIAERQASESAEILANKKLEQERIASEQALQVARIESEQQSEQRSIDRNRQIDTAQIALRQDLETARIAQESAIDRARVEREKLLKALQISERQASEEAEIGAREEIERARIASDRGIEEANIIRERDMKRLRVELEQVVELADIERNILLLQKRMQESEARLATDEIRANAVRAEEAVATVRETEVAKRIAEIDRMLAKKNADTALIAAETDKIRAEVAAEAERLRNEADNLLTEDARAGRLKSQVLERLEGIVRESVKPLQNIDGIRILHVDGLAGGNANTSRSPTDEVIESALRYRAQAPLIDQMMKEIGVEGANVSKMGDIFRSAKDAQSIAKESKSTIADDADN